MQIRSVLSTGMQKLMEEYWFLNFQARSSLKIFEPGQTILFQGARAEYIGLVLSGEVEAVNYSENGQEIWMGDFASGEFFAQLALLENSISSLEFSAKTKAEVMLIRPQIILKELSQDESFLAHFTKDFATRLARATTGFLDTHTKTTKGRICAELLRLSVEIGIDPGKYIIRPNPVYTKLARRLNSTRETVSRTVSDLQTMGVISRSPGALVVEDIDKLKSAFAVE